MLILSRKFGLKLVKGLLYGSYLFLACQLFYPSAIKAVGYSDHQRHQAISGHFLRRLPKKLVGTITYERWLDCI